MSSIALIGPDGAGKTTLARMLEQSGVLPIKYLYMGVDISASNFALPTSRLAHWLKGQAAHRRPRSIERALDGNATTVPGVVRRSRLRAFLRLINRLGEEAYRHLVSWFYQRRGFAVLYDRHFRFDFGPAILTPGTLTLEQRAHLWFQTHVFPRPGLVIFLDAPGTVLHARKGESTVAELERRRQGFLRQAAEEEKFVRVDATRPLPEVYEDVVAHVLRECGRSKSPYGGSAVRR